MKKFAVAIVALLALSACGSGADPSTETGNGGYLDGNYTVGKVKIDGDDYTCVTMKRGAGDTSWGGLWCKPEPDGTVATDTATP